MLTDRLRLLGKGHAVDESPLLDEAERVASPVFISYATTDRKDALSICRALEKRGAACWISCRDVAAGENYQEAIVRALRNAPAAVLIFSSAANDSDEIKKELSLASRYRIPVITLRMEDVEPTDAFAYELSTRQWINAFQGREKAIGTLVERIAGLNPSASAPKTAPAPKSRNRIVGKRTVATGGLVAALVLVTLAWVFLHASPASTHSMVVRLDGFHLLSSELPRGNAANGARGSHRRFRR